MRISMWAGYLAACLVLAGCAGPRIVDRDQWLAETVKVYKDRNQEQVIRAAEAAISSIAPGRITFVHTADGFTGRRNWFATIIIASASGYDTYKFQTEKTPAGTKATIAIETKGSDGRTVTEVQQNTVASFRLFFNWLDYALGKGSTWITCEEADEKLKLENAKFAPAICTPGPSSGGFTPVQPKPEWTTPSNANPPLPRNSRAGT